MTFSIAARAALAKTWHTFLTCGSDVDVAAEGDLLRFYQPSLGAS